MNRSLRIAVADDELATVSSLGELLMMLKGDLRHRPGELNILENLEAIPRMRHDQFELDVGQLPGLGENLGGHTEFADVMDHSRHPDRFDVLFA